MFYYLSETQVPTIDPISQAVNSQIASSNQNIDQLQKDLRGDLNILSTALSNFTPNTALLIDSDFPSSSAIGQIISELPVFKPKEDIPVAVLNNVSYPLPSSNINQDKPLINSITTHFPTDNQYTTQLLTDTQTILDSLINNLHQTGLNPAIEQQIWDRGRERTLATAQGVIDSKKLAFAGAGWTIPTGDLMRLTLAAQEEYAGKDIDENRTIAIGQAELEQKNLQFSITQAVDLNYRMGHIYSTIQGVIVDAESKRIAALSDINKMAVEVYAKETEVAIEIARLNIETYSKETDIAIAQNKLAVDIYKTEVDALNVDANIQKIIIDSSIAKTDLELKAYIEQSTFDMEAKKANVATYLAQIELAISTQEKIAGITAQMVAAYGSQIHMSGAMGVSYGNSQSNSSTNSTSNSNSNSISNSSSGSTSTIFNHNFKEGQ